LNHSNESNHKEDTVVEFNRIMSTYNVIYHAVKIKDKQNQNSFIIFIKYVKIIIDLKLYELINKIRIIIVYS